MQDIFVASHHGKCFTVAENGEGNITLVWLDGHGFNLDYNQSIEMVEKLNDWKDRSEGLVERVEFIGHPWAKYALTIIDNMVRWGQPVDAETIKAILETAKAAGDFVTPSDLTVR